MEINQTKKYDRRTKCADEEREILPPTVSPNINPSVCDSITPSWTDLQRHLFSYNDFLPSRMGRLYLHLPLAAVSEVLRL